MFNRSKNTYLSLIIFVSGILFSVVLYSQKNYSVNKKYSPLALKEDTKILRDVVFAMHPAIGIYEPKSFYEEKFDEFINKLNDSLNEKDFRLRLKLLFDNLHCGHSEIMLSNAYNKAIRPVALNFLPYYFANINNKVFVGRALNPKKDSLLKPRSEILKINSVPVDSIVHYLKRFITGDGYISSGKSLYMRSGINYYYPSVFGRPDSFLVEYNQKDKINSNWIKAAKLKNLPYFYLGPKEDTTFKKYKHADMSVGYLKDKSAMVLKVRSFKAMGYNKVYKKVFKKLEKDKTKNLIIDLRSNGGGNLANSYKLLTYLMDSTETITMRTVINKYPFKKYTSGNWAFKLTRWALKVTGKKKINGDTTFYSEKIKPSKKYHFNSNIYILNNGGTFSASCIIGAYLKGINRVKIIGTETAGAQEGCNAGITPYYILPNTKIKARIPAFRIIHDVNPKINGHGVLPDYEINYTIDDLLKRKDLEMNFVKDLIKN